MHASRFLIAAGLTFALVACDDNEEHADGGDAGHLDAGRRDAAVPPADGGTDGGRVDAAVPDGAVRDGGAVPDGGAGDGGPTTAGFAMLYHEDFEAGMAWTAGGTNSSWQWGTPAGTLFDNAYSGGSAWETNLTGDYDANENSWVESPAIDLSSASGDVLVRIALQYYTQPNTDGAWLEVSTDGGTTWDKVGTMGEGAAWYDTSMNWWTGAHVGWRLAQVPVSGIAGESDVRFRVHFRSNGNTQYEGVVFDDFWILQGTDLALTVTGLPLECGTRVVVANVGSSTVSSFDLTTVSDGASTTNTESK